MPHQLFQDFEGDPRMQQVRRKGVAKAVRCIMGREARCRSVLVHEAIDERAEQVRPTALRTRKHIDAGRTVPLQQIKQLSVGAWLAQTPIRYSLIVMATILRFF